MKYTMRKSNSVTLYYISVGLEDQGPFSLEQLKVLHVERDSFIWHEGLEEWTTAENIPELNEVIINTTLHELTS